MKKCQQIEELELDNCNAVTFNWVAAYLLYVINPRPGVNALARLKRLFKRYKYPPDGVEGACEFVISQCEVWTDQSEE